MDEERKVFCKNYGQCSKADSKEVFSIKTEEPLICPECKEKLNIYFASKKEKLKKYIVLVSVFLAVTILPLIFVNQLFDLKEPAILSRPIKPSDLQKYYIGTVQLKDNKTKTAVLRIYKVEESPRQITYYYTVNLNTIEGRIDSLGLIIPKDKRIYAPDLGMLLYERSENNRIILRSVDQFKKPYWLFEEAKQ